MMIADQLLQRLALEPARCFQPAQAKVPGKLFLVGEYAVLEPEQPAILFAVDQYLTCHIQLSLQVGKGKLSSNSNEMSDWHYQRTELKSEHAQKWRYVVAAIEVVEQFLGEIARPTQDYYIHIESELVDASGNKYGFGSSGAVVVATIRALLDFYGLLPRDALLIYQLAAIAMMRLGANGSMADLAANTYGGWLYYQAPDRQWLKAKVTELSITELLLMEWRHLVIESLRFPEQMQVLVGWTGQPASTENMVEKLEKQNRQQASYQNFLVQAKQVVTQVRQTFEKQDMLAMQAAVADYRHLLLKLGQSYQLNIETKELTTLVTIAQSYQYEAKSSGAGGGDCGIAIGQKGQNALALAQAWKQQGIQLLEVAVAPRWEMEHETIANGTA